MRRCRYDGGGGGGGGSGRRVRVFPSGCPATSRHPTPSHPSRGSVFLLVRPATSPIGTSSFSPARLFLSPRSASRFSSGSESPLANSARTAGRGGWYDIMVWYAALGRGSCHFFFAGRGGGQLLTATAFLPAPRRAPRPFRHRPPRLFPGFPILAGFSSIFSAVALRPFRKFRLAAGDTFNGTFCWSPVIADHRRQPGAAETRFRECRRK